MKNLICLFLTIFLFANTQAATVTWISGNIGDWNVAANWDSNTIPTAADEVIIGDGEVTIPDGYDALAIRVEVVDSSSLTINSNASLTLDGAVDANALEIFGFFNCAGDLIIDHVTSSGIDPEVGNGIFNRGNVLVTNNGRILINDIAESGIKCNDLTVSFENKGIIKINPVFAGPIGISCNNTDFLNTGVIEVFGSTLSGIRSNTGNFINKGSIKIENTASFGMLITGMFRNKETGNISIKNTTVYGLNVDNTGIFINSADLLIENISNNGIFNDATFANSGNILIKNVSFIGLKNDRDFINGVNGTITIDTCVSKGMENNLNFKNRGNLDIKNVTNGNGIDNFGTIVNRTSAGITFRNIDQNGIDNKPAATITNYNDIVMIEGVKGTGLVNQGSFKNKTDALLLMSGTLNIGINNFGSNALFANEGFVSIAPNSSTTTGIIVQGRFRNKPEAILEVHYAEEAGLQVSSPGDEFLNEGFVTLQSCGSEGTYVAGTVINRGFFTCKFNERGLYIDPAGDFKNTSGFMTIEFNTSAGLENDGLFSNEVDARIDIMDAIDNSGDFENKGFLFTSFDGSNSNTGILENTGAIEDQFGQIFPVADNESVIVAPLTGTLEVGVPYPDALYLGNQTNFSINGWYTGASTTTASAGTYDQATNTFTPDAAAIGLTVLFVEVTLTDGPGTYLLSVEVPDGIVDNGASLPMIGNHNDQFKNSRGLNSLLEGFSEIALYPNPVTDHLNISLDSSIEKATQIVIYNTLGQLELSIPVSGLEAGVFRIDFEKQLTGGLYQLEVQTKTDVIFQERIIVLNQ